MSNRSREVPAQLKPLVDSLLKTKPEIFLGRYNRWYVRYVEGTPEHHLPSFHTEEMAKIWVGWEENNLN